MGIWIGAKLSVREIHLGFISNEHHRWSRKNKGISPVEKNKYALSDTGPSDPQQEPRSEMRCVQATSCPSSSPRGVTQGYTREFHQAYLKFSGPAINCHTCSYMTSEAKCLRGEGSCTIQNSQQCMLKKIFEGIVGTSWGNLCWKTRQPTWVFMGSSWVAGMGQRPTEESSCASQKLGNSAKPYPFKN